MPKPMTILHESAAVGAEVGIITYSINTLKIVDGSVKFRAAPRNVPSAVRALKELGICFHVLTCLGRFDRFATIYLPRGD